MAGGISCFQLDKLKELSSNFEREIQDEEELKKLLKSYEEEFGKVWRESGSIGDPSRRRRMIYPWLEAYARITKLVGGNKKILVKQ